MPQTSRHIDLNELIALQNQFKNATPSSAFWFAAVDAVVSALLQREIEREEQEGPR